MITQRVQTVDTITIEKAKQYILPLPPLAEQQRIVAKIEETFSIFDGIQKFLRSVNKNASKD